MNRLISTLDRLDGKVDDLRDRTARVETQADAAEQAREHARANQRAANDGLSHQLVELRRETQDGVERIGQQYQKLEIRVIELEVARRLIEEQGRSAAIKGGSIGGILATALTAGAGVLSWLAGILHVGPK